MAGPGFINFRLADDDVREGLTTLVTHAATYGRSDAGAGQPVVVEFVSANPTGPLHIGHGRQAALGDALSELLTWTGWKVQREYYYNDAGEQIARLSRSVWTRYQQELGEDVPFPEDGYHGAYVGDIARQLVAELGGEVHLSNCITSERAHIYLARCQRDVGRHRGQDDIGAIDTLAKRLEGRSAAANAFAEPALPIRRIQQHVVGAHLGATGQQGLGEPRGHFLIAAILLDACLVHGQPVAATQFLAHKALQVGPVCVAFHRSTQSASGCHCSRSRATRPGATSNSVRPRAARWM